MNTKPPKRSPAQSRRSAQESELTPLYAVAGLTGAVAATVRNSLVSTQERASRRLSELHTKPGQLEQQAKLSADEIGRFLKAVPEQARALPDLTRTRLSDVQRQAQSYLAEASTIYAELAGRGKRAVDEKILSARQLSGQVERKSEDFFADVTDAVDPAFEKAQETVTVARRTVTGRSATKTVTPRSAAQASATRRATAERMAAEKAAEQQAAEKRAAARKAAARKAAATRAAAKKAAQDAAAATTADADAADSQPS